MALKKSNKKADEWRNKHGIEEPWSEVSTMPSGSEVMYAQTVSRKHGLNPSAIYGINQQESIWKNQTKSEKEHLPILQCNYGWYILYKTTIVEI